MVEFNYLERLLDDEKDIDEYLRLFGDLQEPTKTVLGYTFDIAAYLYTLNLVNEYELFGGYAVLSHLMREYGSDVSKLWRGSNDIDMAGTTNVLNALRSGYNIFSDSESPNILDKRTLKFSSDSERECKIDFSTGDYSKKYGLAQCNTHLGIPLSVISPEDIIRGKLTTPLEEEQHLGDILAMVSVLEKKGYSPEDLSNIFIGTERNEFHNRLKYSSHIFRRDRFGFFPSKDFLGDLEKILSKKKFKQIA